MMNVLLKDHPMSTTPCPDRDLLLGYLLGKLPEDTSEQIATHLDECPTCEAAAETLDQVSDTFVSALEQPVVPTRFGNEPQYQQALQRVLTQASPESASLGGRESTDDRISAALSALGEYELLEKVGEGGMGAVYKARQRNLDRLVALKVLPKGRTDNQAAIGRFYCEMRAVGRLNHPNIVAAHDAREIDGCPVLVMEYVEGLDLAHLTSLTGPLRIGDACELVRQTAVGLQHAHERGLVHRDIKPSNLMLNRQGTVKILDLGLALLSVNQANHAEMTAAGTAMGTADYVSPEQVTDSHSVDIRSDIYSLGCTLYKLLSGRSPFTGPEFKNDVTKMMAHVQQTPPPINLLRTDLPPGLAKVVERMMGRKPEDRFATPGEVAAALGPFVVGCELEQLLNEARGLLGPPPVETPSSASTGRLSASAHPDADVGPASAVSQPQIAPARGWPPRSIAIGLATVAAGFVLVLLGVIVIHIRDKSGREMAITLPDDSQVAVEQNGKQLFDSGKKSDEKLSAARPDEHAAEENWSAPPAKPTARDKEKPFTVVRAGGRREEFKHAPEALATLQTGDAVEVHGNGPFNLPLIRLDKALVLRAAPGYRPRFELTKCEEANRGSLEVRGSLLVEGCDFISPGGRIFWGGGGPCEFHACRCFSRDSGLFIYWRDAASVCVRDCLILNSAVESEAKKIDLLNNIIYQGQYSGVVVMCGLGQAVRLIQNTIIMNPFPGYVLQQVANDVPVGSLPTTVEASGNIFNHWSLVNSYRLPVGKEKEALAWHGRNNLFVGTTEFLGRQDAQGSFVVVKDFAGWKELWGGEEGSRAVEHVDFQAAVLVHGTPEAAMAWLQERVAVVRRQLEPTLKDFGPQWDLIGPGEAYVRALAAGGHPVSPNQLRPEAPEDGPFVLVRQGKALRGYPDLQQAVNAAQDGDIVEIHTNGPVPGCSMGVMGDLTAPPAITLRAAPGYCPVITSDILCNDGILLSVEGLDFRNARLVVNPYAKASGGVVRLANCSFSGLEGDAVRAVFQTATEDGGSEVNNCFISRSLSINGKTSKVAIRNSIIPNVLSATDEVPRRHRIEIRQSILGYPGIVGAWTPWEFLRGETDVTAQGTLFDAVGPVNPPRRGWQVWRGAGNVYAMASYWPSLKELRRELNSPEEGSLETDPAVFDPRTWRLLPESAGYHAGPDGHDLGADVDRVGVTPPADGQES